MRYAHLIVGVLLFAFGALVFLPVLFAVLSAQSSPQRGPGGAVAMAILSGLVFGLGFMLAGTIVFAIGLRPELRRRKTP